MQFPFPAALAAITAAGLLAACSPPPNLQGSNQPVGYENTGRGALVGAAGGAILSNIVTGGDKGATATGAAIGGLVGAGIGRSLDVQAAELRRSLGDQVTVTNNGDYLLVNFPQDILFATDSAAVAPGQRSELSALAANLNAYPGSAVQVVGHTDNTGGAAHNFDLSARRAGAVAAVLVDGGVAGSRITATGKGEDLPIASNLTPEGRARNRRVEVVIRPESA